MILDIQPLHEEGRDCYEDLLVSSTMYIKKECELAFSGAWNFTLLPIDPLEKGLLGPRIYSQLGKIGNLLERYYGISVKNHESKNPVEILEYIKYELLLKHPVIIFMDCYYCPWHTNYKKRHANHACLVIGFEDYGLYCIDALPINTGSILSLENFFSGVYGFSTFSVSKKTEEIDYRGLIKNSLSKLYTTDIGSNAFDDMRTLGSTISDNLDLARESYGYSLLWEVPLFINLQKVAGGRVHYAKFLNYLAVHCQIDSLLPISEQFEFMASSWSKVRSMLIKSSMMPANQAINYDTTDIINKNADIEEEVAYKLSNIVTSTTSYMFSNLYSDNTPIKPNIEISEFTYLKLNKYFNNKGFGKDTVSEYNKADLSGTGNFILFDGIAHDSIWNVDMMQFKFPVISETEYDNLSCIGQVIHVNRDIYKAVMLLGTSEWGNFKDEMVINFISGEAETAPLAFSDWINSPIYGEKIAWVGKGAYRNKNGIELLNQKVSLFARIHYVKKIGAIDSITLPNCPGIHIFAISLGK